MAEPAFEDPMQTDDVVEETQSTQQATQETQPLSQVDASVDDHLWGMLIPSNPTLRRIDFQKVKKVYHVGRNAEKVKGGNDVVFPGRKISNYHCRIEWDGKKGKASAVTVTDISSNGTYINQQRIGKSKSHLLYDGNEISFGSWQPQQGPGAEDDYRFTFRHMAATSDLKGMFQHYQIHENLGSGTFANVSKAMHRETGRWYAIKTMERRRLRSNADVDANPDAAFSREISILQELNHSRICKLKEVFYEAHTINLVLELVDGGDLLDFIVNHPNGRLPEELSQHFTYQMCDALQYIHSKGIAHRDLKPENVLLTREDPPMVKVADFGLAKAVDSMTMLRTMCGTPSYLAPEVVLQQNLGGEGERVMSGYDHLVDSWSVGVIVYCMLTGSNPFSDDNSVPLSQQVRKRQVDWNCLELYNDNPAARDFVERLLAYSPTLRMPPSAALEHPWLIEFEHLATHVPLGNLPPADSQYSQSQLHNSQGSADADDDADAPMDGPADADASMREEPLPGSQLPGLPGSFPQSQPLQRRVDVLLAQSQQERGEEEFVYSDDETNGGGAEPGARGTKRKALEFEGSLTPMEEEEESEEDPDAMLVSPRKPARAARGRGAASGRPPRKQAAQRGAKRATTTAGGTRRSERLGNGTPGKGKTV